MIYYAKEIDESGVLVALHTMDRPFPEDAEGFVPITEAEYAALLEDLMAQESDEISDSEALAIIMGGDA